MNVCIVSADFQMGGAERITIGLANGLSNNHHVSVIDFSGENSFYYELDSKVNIISGIPKKSAYSKILSLWLRFTYKLTHKDFNPELIYSKQVSCLKKILKQSDFDKVILCQGLLTAFIPSLKKAIPCLKMVAWQHNNYSIYTQKYHKNILKYYMSGVNQADQVICLTKSDEVLFEKINSRTICIYNALTIETTQISSVKNKNIVFAGRLLMEQKGLDFLIEIAKEVEIGWKIFIAGDGPDRKKFKRMIRTHSLENKIILLGNLKSDELTQLYSNSSVFISTSRWEGFGLVITEAMVAGLPIISFDNSGPVEILSNGEYGLVIKKYDVKDFSDKLHQLTNDFNQRKYWQVKSLERAKYFNKDNIIRQWEDLLEKM